MKTNAKSAFTLIEMLVVIGIIGILAGVLLSTFGGATESAKASQCEANLRNLATAATTYAMQESNGHFPAAGSFVYLHIDTRKRKFKKDDLQHMRFGWISGTEKPGDKQVGGIIPFNSKSDETLRYAITNGANGKIWQIVSGARKTYQCPVHAETCREVNKKLPGWSYVMNREFGWNDPSYKTRPNSFFGLTLSGLSLYSKAKKKYYPRDPSRVLLFAEMQGTDISDKIHGVQIQAEPTASGTRADGVLDYETEAIGFNHKLKRGRYAGHVAFADGHVEKITNPVGGGLSTLKLTEALCRGHELRFDGKMYEDLQPE